MKQAPPTSTRLDLDDLIARIRREAARLEGAEVPDMAPPTQSAPLPPTQPTPPAPTPASDAAAQPEPMAGLGELLAQDEAAFLDQAYRAVLGRSPDESGIQRYQPYLEQGGSRSYVVASLLWSEEAAEHPRPLPGSGWIRALRPLPGKRIWIPLCHLVDAGYALRRRFRIAHRVHSLEIQTKAQSAWLEQALAAQDRRYEQALADQDLGLEQALANRDHRYERTFSDRDRAFEQALTERDAEFKQALEVQDQRREQALADRARQFEATLSARDQRFEQALADLERQFEQTLADRDQRLEQALVDRDPELQGQVLQALELGQSIRAQMGELTERIALLEAQGNLEQRLPALVGDVAVLAGVPTRVLELERESDRVRGLNELLHARQETLSAEVTDVLDWRERVARLQQDFDFVRSDMIYHRGRLHDLRIQLERSAARDDGPPAGDGATSSQPVNGAEADALDGYYVAFESVFRGDRADITETMGHYLPDLKNAASVTADKPLLDLGCGRGEWLHLLSEQGVNARGVDLNSAMIAQCRELGLEVAQSDALAALRACRNASLGAVSAIHILEHLPFPVLFELLRQAFRALIPGGILLVETPNPENILVGSHTFYHDPTHRNPLTPDSMRFLLRYNGFTEPEIRRLHPYPEAAKVAGDDPLTERVNGHLCGPQDFALIARKPGGDP
jgi:SAM-dependent methyltransferase